MASGLPLPAGPAASGPLVSTERVGRLAVHDGLLAILPLVAVASLGAAAGGYNEPAWGWSALALLWASALGLLLRPEIRLGFFEIGFVGAFLAFGLWTLVSTPWGATATEAVRESQRTIVYIAGVVAVLVLVRARSHRWFVGGVWAACVLVSTYALGTRLFTPDPLTGEFEGYRLSAALGYWNALGIFAAIGVPLALGLAARVSNRVVAGVAAGSTVPLLATIYFTFGRGPWIALAVGIAAAVALDPRRLQFAAMTLVLAAPGAVALWLAFHSEALTRHGSAVSDAEREGERLAVALLILSVVAAGSAVAFRVLGTRLEVGRRMRLGFGGAILIALAFAMLGTFARHGSPPVLVEKVVDGLNAPSVQTNGDLSKRFFDLSSSGRIEHWRVAWSTFEEQPLLGSGAGTYERHWLEDRGDPATVRDAHNLYLETMAELGIVGLALLVVALGIPIVAAVRARHNALVPTALAAYIAYLAHAGIDWDWEMPAVTLAALFCACAILAAERGSSRTIVLGARARGGLVAATLALAAVAIVGLVGNQALAASEDAERSGQLARAESEARKAIRWAPWSSAGWERLSQVHFAQDDVKSARVALLEAVEKSPGSWGLWFDLGVASEGADRQRAYEEAARLNPLSANVGVLRTLGVLPPLGVEEER